VVRSGCTRARVVRRFGAEGGGVEQRARGECFCASKVDLGPTTDYPDGTSSGCHIGGARGGRPLGGSAAWGKVKRVQGADYPVSRPSYRGRTGPRAERWGSGAGEADYRL